MGELELSSVFPNSLYFYAAAAHMNRLLRRRDQGGGSSCEGESTPLPPSEAPTPRAMRRQRTEGEIPPRGRNLPAARNIRGYSSQSDVHYNSNSSESSLPSAWNITDPALRHTDPLCVVMNASCKTTVYANRSIPRSQLRQKSQSASVSSSPSWRRRSTEGGHASRSDHDAYYFEVTVIAPHPQANVDLSIGLFSTRESFGAWPGELPNSFGWGCEGLRANGQSDDGSTPGIQFRNGDVVGCGIEVGGLQRVFFTCNGSIVVPPSPNTSVLGDNDQECWPVISFRHGGENVLKANFGLDATPFRWNRTGRSRIVQLIDRPERPSVPYPPPTTTDSPSMFRPDHAGRSRSSSPYYSISELDRFDDPMKQVPMSPQNDPVSTRSASRPSSGLGIPQVSSPRYGQSPKPPPNNNSPPSAYFGTKNNNRRSLVDEDPESNKPVTSDHFNLDPMGGTSRQSSSAYNTEQPGDMSQHPRRAMSGSDVSANRRQSRGEERSSRRRADVRVHGAGEESMNLIYEDSEAPNAAIHPSAEAAKPDDVLVAKINSQKLLAAAAKKDRDFDADYVREMLDVCKKDQERLQLKLSNAVEETDAIGNIEELFAVNDGICSAIDAGKEAMKRVKERTKKKKSKSMQGPTIELLVENEDVFSLICMLRAPNEKRLAAALALMVFARDNDMLRNEIRSSGGMHSFLTLFRTKGMTRELQVVSGLAVAYLLTSFVVSSQPPSNVCLKIMECLRFLAVSKPVTPQNTYIAREEMCKAASMGVNLLWVNAIQPLITMEKAKSESRQTRPVLRPSASVRLTRMRSRAGGSVFDQGQESIEIKELIEMAVTLIAKIAKAGFGYNIVEQVCEVDEARPIAVREGLLRVLVDWIQSKEVEKVRPAASALRYLISIEDKYMAGWIHSQVVNEGAIGEIVQLLNESVGHDVRVAVAQMLSALCIAPHTRAAVVESKCVSYLVALLYEHSAPASEEMVHYAGSALLQLAAGAMTRASASTGYNLAITDSDNPDKQETVVTYVNLELCLRDMNLFVRTYLSFFLSF